jgi:hypothetical protein
LVSTKHAGVPSLTVFRALWAAADASAAVDDVAILNSEILNYVRKTFSNSSIECEVLWKEDTGWLWAVLDEITYHDQCLTLTGDSRSSV